MGGSNDYTTTFQSLSVCSEAILMLHFQVWIWDLLSTKLLIPFLTKCVDNKEAIKLRSNFYTLLLQLQIKTFLNNRPRYCHCNYTELFYWHCNDSHMRVSCKLSSSQIALFFSSYAPVTKNTVKCAAATTRVQKHNNCNKALLCNINQNTRSTVN